MNKAISTLDRFKNDYDAIIFMKIGYHTDEDIKEIINRKIVEERLVGFFSGDMGEAFATLLIKSYLL